MDNKYLIETKNGTFSLLKFIKDISYEQKDGIDSFVNTCDLGWFGCLNFFKSKYRQICYNTEKKNLKGMMYLSLSKVETKYVFIDIIDVMINQLVKNYFCITKYNNSYEYKIEIDIDHNKNIATFKGYFLSSTILGYEFNIDIEYYTKTLFKQDYSIKSLSCKIHTIYLDRDITNNPKTRANIECVCDRLSEDKAKIYINDKSSHLSRVLKLIGIYLSEYIIDDVMR